MWYLMSDEALYLASFLWWCPQFLDLIHLKENIYGIINIFIIWYNGRFPIKYYNYHFDFHGIVFFIFFFL